MSTAGWQANHGLTIHGPLDHKAELNGAVRTPKAASSHKVPGWVRQWLPSPGHLVACLC